MGVPARLGQSPPMLQQHGRTGMDSSFDALASTATAGASRMTNIVVLFSRVATVSDTSNIPQNDTGTFLSYIHTYMHTYIQTYIHTCIQTDRQTERQTDRQTDIRTYVHTSMHTYTYVHILYRYMYMPMYMYMYCMGISNLYTTCTDQLQRVMWSGMFRQAASVSAVAEAAVSHTGFSHPPPSELHYWIIHGDVSIYRDPTNTNTEHPPMQACKGILPRVLTMACLGGGLDS